MSTEINGSYVTPWSIDMYPLDNGELTTWKPNGWAVGVKDDSRAYAIAFYTVHTNHRVQWRIKRRKAPAYAALAADYNGGDVWVAWDGTIGSGSESADQTQEWGAWQGTTSETASALSDGGPGYGDGDRLRYLTSTFPFAYDFDEYDLTVYQIRVQAFNASGTVHQTSEWAYQEVTVGYCPKVTLTAGQSIGHVNMHVSTNWTRDGNVLDMSNPVFCDGGSVVWLPADQLARQTVASDDDVTMPQSWVTTIPEYASDHNSILLAALDDGPADGGGVWFRTSDGFYGYFPDQPTYGRFAEIPITVAAVSGDVPEPDVSIDRYGEVTIPDNGYDSVHVMAYWQDEDGRRYSQLVDMVLVGGDWVGEIEDPPYDVTYDVRVACTKDGDYNYWTKSVTVSSGGIIAFDWGDSHFEMRYNTARSYNVDLVNETVSVAGRKLPVSVHSDQHTSVIVANGTLINPRKVDIGDGWFAELHKLEEPHDWILRAPGGMRRRVVIEGYTLGFDDSTAETLVDVTVTMNEVADELEQ